MWGKMKNLIGRSGNKLLFFNLVLNGWILYAKFRFNFLNLIAVPLIVVFFLVLAVRGMVLFARNASVNALVPRVLPIVVFLGIAAIPPYCTAYIEYKIRSADFAQDIARKKNMTDTQYMTWDKWNNWVEDFDFFIYSDDVLPEDREIRPRPGDCLGNARRLEGNFYVFFSRCDSLF